MMNSQTHLIVRYAETDQMGIVHHSNYPIWFEAGRTDFFKQLGFPYGLIEKKGIIAPLISMNVSFKLPALYEDQIMVVTRIASFSVVKLQFKYDVIRKDDGRMLVHGKTEHAWTDQDLKPVNLFKKDPQLFDLLTRSSAD